MIKDAVRVERPFIGGDEVMIVFTLERMLEIGFPDDAFARPR